MYSKTKGGLDVRILHQCSSPMKQLLGYIILADGTEIPSVWSNRGDCFSRLLGTTSKFDDFDLIIPQEEAT